MAFTITDLLKNDNIYRVTVNTAVLDNLGSGEITVALNNNSSSTLGDIDCVRTVDSDGVTNFSKNTNSLAIVAGIDKTQSNKLTITNTSDVCVVVQNIELSNHKKIVPDSDKSWYGSYASLLDGGFVSSLNSALALSDIADLKAFVAGAFKEYYSANSQLFETDSEFATSKWNSILRNGATESSTGSGFDAIIMTPGDIIEVDLGDMFSTAQAEFSTGAGIVKYPYSQEYINSKKV
jgi:hypothetical protein